MFPCFEEWTVTNNFYNIDHQYLHYKQLYYYLSLRRILRLYDFWFLGNKFL